jgi:hypothetical protein
MLKFRHSAETSEEPGSERTGMPRIIHYGADTCMRISVLRSAGFEVIACDSVAGLVETLRGEPGMGAVLVGDTDEAAMECAVRAVRSGSRAALVLFQSRLSSESTFDLVVAPQTPPQAWLSAIGELLGVERRGAEPAGEMRRAEGDAEAEQAADRVCDWHAVALSITRKPGSPGGGEADGSMGGRKSPRRA